MASTTKTVEHNRLTQVDLTEIQKTLLSKRQSLIENSVSLIQNAEHNGSNHSDLIDKASVEEEFRMKLCAQALEQNLIRDIDNALQNIKNGIYPTEKLKGASNAFRDFIACLLEVDPNKRYTADHAGKHPWVGDVCVCFF